MEQNKVKGPAKSIVLPNGAELTYCERGEQNKDIIITTAFYFHTFMPVIEGLAERYHVYGIVMRFDGITDLKNADGSTHWGKQTEHHARKAANGFRKRNHYSQKREHVS